MSEMPEGPVVVGFDPFAAAAQTLEVAAEEASAAGVPLLVVHVYGWPILYASLANIPFVPEDWRPSPDAVATTEAAAASLALAHPGLDVSVSVRVGRGGEQLVAASEHASLLVVGATGARGLSGLMTGSVTSYVATHAHCPVMVVRNATIRARLSAEVCVGVDGTPSSLDALRFATGWARRHGVGVRALYAVDTFDEPVPEDGGHTLAETRLHDWVSEGLASSDGTPIEVAVVRQAPAAALVAASAAARLVVVGSRHRGEFASRVLGSVGHSLVRRAGCPVVIVPDPFGVTPAPATVPATEVRR